jgi:2-hydroxymuconate-semialdehyde hydrolase
MADALEPDPAYVRGVHTSSEGSSDRARMLAGLPVDERRSEVAGVRTSILRGGAGPPLVLLHGGIECGGAYWAPVIPELATGHRLIVPDVPGLGESQPLTRLDAKSFERWLSALIEFTCEEPPALIAHSLLGGMAAGFGARRAGELRRLCVYAGPGIAPYRMPMRLRVVATRFAVRPTRENAERFERFALLDRERTRRRSPGWFDSFSAYSLERARQPHVKRTMNQLIRRGTRRHPEASLRRIEVPVSLLWGRSDRMVPLKVASWAKARFGWPLQLVDDSAHAPHIERPGAFLKALERALQQP